MDQEKIGGPPQDAVRKRKRGKSKRGLSGLWRRVREPLRNSRWVQSALVSFFANYLWFVKRTARPVDGSIEAVGDFAKVEPFILALWHGQHIAGPIAYPGGRPLVVLFSRSADAELNARVAEKMGLEVVRGSGGREKHSGSVDKGGAKALIQLKRSLDEGKNVCMIADIPHGTPRESGQGVILLASLSGRPILPVAITTSRRLVLEKTWDKTTINFPFGRRAIVVGEPIFVGRKVDESELEMKRQELTRSLNGATEKAAAMVDGAA